MSLLFTHLTVLALCASPGLGMRRTSDYNPSPYSSMSSASSSGSSSGSWLPPLRTSPHPSLDNVRFATPPTTYGNSYDSRYSPVDYVSSPVPSYHTLNHPLSPAPSFNTIDHYTIPAQPVIHVAPPTHRKTRGGKESRQDGPPASTAETLRLRLPDLDKEMRASLITEHLSHLPTPLYSYPIIQSVLIKSENGKLIDQLLRAEQKPNFVKSHSAAAYALRALTLATSLEARRRYDPGPLLREILEAVPGIGYRDLATRLVSDTLKRNITPNDAALVLASIAPGLHWKVIEEILTRDLPHLHLVDHSLVLGTILPYLPRDHTFTLCTKGRSATIKRLSKGPSPLPSTIPEYIHAHYPTGTSTSTPRHQVERAFLNDISRRLLSAVPEFSLAETAMGPPVFSGTRDLTHLCIGPIEERNSRFPSPWISRKATWSSQEGVCSRGHTGHGSHTLVHLLPKGDPLMHEGGVALERVMKKVASHEKAKHGTPLLISNHPHYWIFS